MYLLQCRLTADKRQNNIHVIEYVISGSDLPTLKHLAIDVEAKHCVENNSLFGKLKLRVNVIEDGVKIETLKAGCDRHRTAGNPLFVSGVRM